MSRTRIPRTLLSPSPRAAQRSRNRWPARLRRCRLVAAHLLTVALIVSVPTAALADPGPTADLAANTLPVVIDKLRTAIMLLLGGIATLFLVLAGVYYATAAGDPAQVDKGKNAFKNALVGYGLAVLAPILLELVRSIVGG